VITSEQIRAARAFLRISVVEASKISGVGVATIKRLEAQEGVPSVHVRTLELLESAFNKLGIEFIGTPSNSPGVRFKQHD